MAPRARALGIAAFVVLTLASAPLWWPAELPHREPAGPDASSAREVQVLGSRTHDLSGAAGAERATAPESSSRAALAAEVAPELAPGEVRGRVRGSSGIPSATVKLELWVAESARCAIELRTARDGSFVARLPGLAELDALEFVTASVRATAWAPGHPPASDERALSDPRRCVEGLELTLESGGGWARGRVVDASGAPVPGARVSSSAAFRLREGVESDASGAFTVACSRGPLTTVSARHPALGLCSVTVDSSGSEAGVELGDLTLRCDGWIGGVVVDAQGTAIPGMRIRASPLRQARRVVLESGEELVFHDFAAERDALQLRTSSDGSFRFAAGSAEPFRVRSEDDGGSDLGSQFADADESGTDGVRAGAEDLRLVVPGTWISVRTIDARGRPAPGVEVVLRSAAPSVFGRTPRIVCEGPDARACARVEPGEWTLGVESRSYAAAEVRVSAVRDSVTLAELVVGPPAGTGRMRVALREPDGTPIEDFAVELSAPGAASPSATYRYFETDSDGVSPPLPSGLFDCRVLPFPARDALRQMYLPLEVPAQVISPSEPVELDLTVRLGARLSLEHVLAGETFVLPVKLELLERDGSLRPLRVGAFRADRTDPTRSRHLAEIEHLFEPGAALLRVTYPDGFAEELRTVLAEGDDNVLALSR